MHCIMVPFFVALHSATPITLSKERHAAPTNIHAFSCDLAAEFLQASLVGGNVLQQVVLSFWYTWLCLFCCWRWR